MGICGLCMERDKKKNRDDNNLDIDYDYVKLKERIKNESSKMHQIFLENIVIIFKFRRTHLLITKCFLQWKK